MISVEDKNFLRELLTKTFDKTNEVEHGVETAIEHILVSARAVYERTGSVYYGDFRVYTSIELALYREGYPKTAKQFYEFWNEEYKQPRVFRNVTEYGYLD